MSDDNGRPSTSTDGKHGGKRFKSGRKETGYKQVRSLLWKNISFHTDVYHKWMETRERLNYKDHSSFAMFLLDKIASEDQESIGEISSEAVLPTTSQEQMATRFDIKY